MDLNETLKKIQEKQWEKFTATDLNNIWKKVQEIQSELSKNKTLNETLKKRPFPFYAVWDSCLIGLCPHEIWDSASLFLLRALELAALRGWEGS